jgi:hypothetical protein
MTSPPACFMHAGFDGTTIRTNWLGWIQILQPYAGQLPQPYFTISFDAGAIFCKVRNNHCFNRSHLRCLRQTWLSESVRNIKRSPTQAIRQFVAKIVGKRKNGNACMVQKPHLNTGSSTFAVIIVQNAAQDIAPMNAACSGRYHEDRCSLFQSLMWTGGIIVVRVFSQHPVEMRLIENNQLIETLLPNGTNPAFRNHIRLRCSGRHTDDFNCRTQGTCRVHRRTTDRSTPQRIQRHYLG